MRWDPVQNAAHCRSCPAETLQHGIRPTDPLAASLPPHVPAISAPWRATGDGHHGVALPRIPEPLGTQGLELIGEAVALMLTDTSEPPRGRGHGLSRGGGPKQDAPPAPGRVARSHVRADPVSGGGSSGHEGFSARRDPREAPARRRAPRPGPGGRGDRHDPRGHRGDVRPLASGVRRDVPGSADFLINNPSVVDGSLYAAGCLYPILSATSARDFRPRSPIYRGRGKINNRPSLSPHPTPAAFRIGRQSSFTH